MNQFYEDVLADNVATALRSLESHARTATGSATVIVTAQVIRHHSAEHGLSGPVVDWRVALFPWPSDKRSAHGDGKTYGAALADATKQANALLSPQPTQALDLNDPRM